MALLFTPVTPCRAFSTEAAGARLAVNETRSFVITGSASLAAQGGSSKGCGVPAYATAVAISLTTLNSAGTGHLRAFANGGAVPQTRAVSYRAGVYETTSQIVELGAGRIALKAFSAATGAAGDVTGYYAPQIHGLVYTGGGSSAVYSGTPAILSVEKISAGVADVTVDRDVTYCSSLSSAYYDKYYYTDTRGFSGSKIRVYSWYLDSSTHAPVYIDNYVYLAVHC